MVYRRTERTEERREQRRQQILRAARRHFVRHGYVETTVQQIAVSARTSIGNVYFYFANKEALLRALLETAMDTEWPRADAIAEQLRPGPARLAVMTLCNTDWLLDRDRDVIGMIVASSTVGHLADWVAAQNGARIRRYLKENVPTLIGSDPAGVVAMWGGAGRAMVELSFRDPKGLPARVRAIELLQWNLRGLGLTATEIDRTIEMAERAIAKAD